MRNADGALFCSASGMELSRNLETQFHAIYVDGIDASEQDHFLDGIDILFCPGCAQRLVKGDDGTARCPECRRTMGGLVYEIIEFHPHCVS